MMPQSQALDAPSAHSLISEASDDTACFELIGQMRPVEVIARFTVGGEPVSKARARFTNYGSKGRTYTPEKTKTAEAMVAKAFRSTVPAHTPDADTVYGVFAVFYCGTRQRRDVDNMLKLICDGLNKVAWADDVQVREITGRRDYTATQDEARTEVLVYRLGMTDRPKRNCVHCGMAFDMYQSTSARKYCSRDCITAAARAKRLKVCAGCGEEFVDANGGEPAKYCSKACVYRHKTTEVLCLVCGTPFRLPQSLAGKSNPTCGDECRAVHESTCVHGHPWADHLRTRANGNRYCAECNRASARKRKAKSA